MVIEKNVIYEAIKAKFKATRKLEPTIQQVAPVCMYTHTYV